MVEMTPGELKSQVWKLLQELNQKGGVSEVIINNPESIFIEHQGDLIKINAKLNAQEVWTFAQEVARLNQKHFDAAHPILDGTLPDGSRINMITKDYALGGPAITIRRYLKTLTDLTSSASAYRLNTKWVDFFKSLIKARMNVVITGGTGTGKTTLLNLLVQEVSPLERLVTIEDTRELSFQLPNVVRLESRTAETHGIAPLSIRDLVKNALRMRPDRLLIGEIRGPEAFDLLQVLNSGHRGSLCSLHANSPGEAITRLENLFLLAGVDVPVRAIRHSISTAVDFFIHLKRLPDGKRVVSQVTEVSGLESERVLLGDVGLYRGEQLAFTGLVPKCMPKLIENGLEREFFVGT